MPHSHACETPRLPSSLDLMFSRWSSSRQTLIYLRTRVIVVPIKTKSTLLREKATKKQLPRYKQFSKSKTMHSIPHSVSKSKKRTAATKVPRQRHAPCPSGDPRERGHSSKANYFWALEIRCPCNNRKQAPIHDAEVAQRCSTKTYQNKPR